MRTYTFHLEQHSSGINTEARERHPTSIQQYRRVKLGMQLRGRGPRQCGKVTKVPIKHALTLQQP